MIGYESTSNTSSSSVQPLEKVILRILCVEDNDGDYVLLEEYLKDAAFYPIPVLRHAKTLTEAIAILKQEHEGEDLFDIILLDLSLPDSFGTETFFKIRNVAPETAVTILSGNSDHDLAVAMVQEGAQDYLPKDQLSSDLLMRSILYALERQRSSIRMKKLNEQLQKATHDLQTMQMQLIQAEKLESLGRLAAGVAHEVKNPLSVLQMGVDFFSQRIEGLDEGATTILNWMQDAITRAETIIHDMLDVSRSEQFEVRPCCINTLAECALRMVNHELVRRKIDVITEFATPPPIARVDQGKLEQVLINVMTNAAHVMTNGGVLELRTLFGQIDSIPHNDGMREMERLHSGDEVVVIEVRDHGPGIPEEIMSRIYEPFFTTKPTGEGTGLGLSVAKKIIDLHRGHLQIKNVDDPRGLRVRIILKADFSSPPENLVRNSSHTELSIQPSLN